MNIFKNILLYLIIVYISCQKIINVHLNSTNPQVVIEGEINDQFDAHVYLSQTVNYSDTVLFKGIADAFITITDNTNGMCDTLMPRKFINNPLIIGHYYGKKFGGFKGIPIVY